MGISREQWQAIGPLLTHALDLPDAMRADWLAELERTRPDLALLLLPLLQADERAATLRAFETSSMLAGAMPRTVDGWQVGQLIDRYRLSRPLGHGGMGDVWLARQIDGGIQRDVALKLPMLVGRAGSWRDRFRRERDILARLQHPNIATLYDAGFAELPGGIEQPFLAMEYVEGVNLLEHAAQRELSLHDRLQLFRQVLAAVGAAHRRLVIHRDIKPSNILVRPDGQAKLLDFGIAKLMRDDTATTSDDDLTRIGGRLLTLRYAAPEQATGESLSTATDVYALGVVLHELLTGQSPHRRVREGASLRVADLQQAEFALPSSLTADRRLEGDLDAILLKSLRCDPAERFGTVEQFDDDLRRFLEHQPVLARRGNRRYRFSRFVVRNRLPLAATAATVLSLAVGLAVSLEQRSAAIAARARAEGHARSVRELANIFIYDVDTQLRGLAGTLPARRKLAETAVKYLDSLSVEAADNPALAAEVAGGYLRMGEVLGGTSDGNLGQWDESLVVFEKAARLLDGLGTHGRDDARILQDLENAHTQLTSQYYQRNDPRWEAEGLKAIEAHRALARIRGNVAPDRIRLAVRMIEHVAVLDGFSSSPVVGSPLLQEGRALLDGAAAEVGSDRRARIRLGTGYLRIGEILLGAGATTAQAGEALVHAQRAVHILDPLVAELPNETTTALLLETARAIVADALLRLDRPVDAEREMQKVIANLESARASDPANMDLIANYWAALSQGVETAFRAGRSDLARQRTSEAQRYWRKLPQVVQDAHGVARYKLALDYYGGLALLGAGPPMREAACGSLRSAELSLARLVRMKPRADASPYSGLPTALAACRENDGTN